jgi:diguanylate cyclase (GGDEF)-like protein/PAS domain S-box-containing protein
MAKFLQRISQNFVDDASTSPPFRLELDADWGGAMARLLDMDVAGIAEVDLRRRRFLRVNRQYCRLMRRDECELLGMETSEVLAAEGRDAVAAEIGTATAQWGRWQGELRHGLGDGALAWMRVSVSVYQWDADGTPSRAVSVIQDVTERVAAVEKLKLSEQLLMLGQQVGDIATFVRDLRTDAVACNANSRRIMGLPQGEQELPVEVWRQAFIPEDRDRIAAVMSAAIRRRDAEVGYEFRVRRPGETEIRHFEMRARYFYDDEGRPLSTVGVAIDVTERARSAQKLKISEEMLSLGQEAGQIATYVRDFKTNNIACSAYGRRLLGLPEGEDEIPIEIWSRAILPEDMKKAVALSDAAIARKASEFAFEIRLRRPNETEVRHFEMRARLVYDDAGQPLRSVGVAIDVTNRVRSVEKARLNEEIRRLAHEAGRIGTFSRDLCSDTFEIPPEARAILGVPDEVKQFTVSYWRDCIPPEDRQRVAALMRDAPARGDPGIDYETRIVRPVDGELRWICGRGRYLLDENRRPARVLGVFIDVTDRRLAEERLAQAARHDALTDLPNRTLFRERLDEALARSRRGEGFAVLCLDLDRFKEVNDTLGHALGDRLLVQVAARIAGEVRQTDTLSRLGGDEFAILQTRVDAPVCSEKMAQRLVAKISQPYELDGHLIHVGVSVGIALAPADGGDHDALMRAADMALYQAKGDGRGCFAFFNPEMNARMQTRRALQNDLREALERGEYELFYQPVIDVGSRRIVGFEALIRWRRTDGKLVPPDAFIPLCEESGLIAPLGAWVIATACAEAATWERPLGVAVNLSPMQFATGRLEADVAKALAASTLAPARLELEITESAVLQDTQTTLATLSRLKARGIHIAMDDFGAGYSSLTHLQQFPFDRVKIDRAFTREIARSRKSLAIVKAMTDLCRALEMSTTAEGVETEEQFRVIAGLGCQHAQGYLFSPPRPASDIPELLAKFGSCGSVAVAAE